MIHPSVRRRLRKIFESAAAGPHLRFPRQDPFPLGFETGGELPPPVFAKRQVTLRSPYAHSRVSIAGSAYANPVPASGTIPTPISSTSSSWKRRAVPNDWRDTSTHLRAFAAASNRLSAVVL